MNTSVLRASWTLVRCSALLLPAGAALLLAAAALPVLDDGYALLVLRGVGVLLACAWVVTMDDPSGEILAASPYPRRVRFTARAAAGLVVVVPTWTTSALLVHWRAPEVPVLGLGVEALALAVSGIAVAAGLRAWSGLMTPSYVAIIGLVALAFTTNALPRTYAMTQEQIWGPPWVAAQLRWAALLVLALAVVCMAFRDPLARYPAMVFRIRSTMSR